jgi:hypothetical protein
MLPNEFYSSTYPGGYISVRLHRLRPDGTWEPPVPPEARDQIPPHLRSATARHASSGRTLTRRGGECTLVQRPAVTAVARSRSEAAPVAAFRVPRPLPAWWLGEVEYWRL